MNDYLKTMRKLVGSRLIHLPGVRGIILNEAEEVLLQRRTDMPLWGLPSGSVELDETALEALKREVAEETSLQVVQAEPMAIYSGPTQRFAYPNGDEIQCFSVAFIVRQWEGQPRADGAEGSEVRFFPLPGLPDDMVSIHKHTLSDFERYDGTFFLT
ncbi:MAG: NUDIX domain-containing protein [Phycisphaerae bacterium]|jgi:ADP-ribose pyrophosphatase YjhB (NUDIX family)|nr:NUDIX domain-containing protein [Phycisphaerae bacterium]MDP7636082.1 NUDIX domain-containing protein [Phycisphaerae bacterium]